MTELRVGSWNGFSKRSGAMRLAFATVASFSFSETLAQAGVGEGPVADLYKQYCASCHGADLEGGSGSSLIDDEWVHGSSAEEIAAVISDGVPNMGMPGFSSGLSPEEIRSLVIYIRERKLMAESGGDQTQLPQGGVYATDLHDFNLETIAETSDRFWSVNFLSNGDLITTERGGSLYIMRDSLLKEIEDTPHVWRKGQGGLLAVAPHPDHAENGWIYLSFSAQQGTSNGDIAGMTKVVRGRIKGDRWTDEQTIFEAAGGDYSQSAQHFGSRFTFDGGYIYFSIGDRGDIHACQDLKKPNGKIFRLHDDGRIPEDNPFVDEPGAYQGIWSYGHRNPQGLAHDPVTGLLYAAEHGPRGGDELNVITKGANYGWPVVTYGMNYDGTPITDKTSAPGMEQPLHYWTPSIASGAIAFYDGDKFPNWRGDLFVAALKSQQVRRLRIKDGTVIEEEIIYHAPGKVREIAIGPDGSIYITYRNGKLKKSFMHRLTPHQRRD